MISPYRSDIARAISDLDLSSIRKVFLVGSGFVGSWLLEALSYLGIETIVLVRDAEKFRKLHPWIMEHVRLHVGDIQSFATPEDAFGCDVIHAALPEPMSNGLTHVLCAARNLGARRFLLVSTGAAGRQTPFGMEKDRAEGTCRYANSVLDLEVRIARGWTFSGAWLGKNYAISRFVNAVLAGERLRVYGTGSKIRSYLYGADAAVWILQVLACGRPDAVYDIGSRIPVSIAELAATVARVASKEFPGHLIEIDAGCHEAFKALAPDRYVPEGEPPLGLKENFTLEEQITRMLQG